MYIVECVGLPFWNFGLIFGNLDYLGLIFLGFDSEWYLEVNWSWHSQKF